MTKYPFRDAKGRIILTKRRAILFVTILLVLCGCIAAAAFSIVGHDERVNQCTAIFSAALFVLWIFSVHKIRKT